MVRHLHTNINIFRKVSFEVSIITPFAGVTLEVGGDVETYWKSTTIPASPRTSKLASSRSGRLSGGTVSSQNSPLNPANATFPGRLPAISSLKGRHAYFVIQVTKDFHPVVYLDWLLPETRFAICVADVTLEQFEALATTQRRRMDSPIDMSAPDWHAKAFRSMVSLAQLMQVRRH